MYLSPGAFYHACCVKNGFSACPFQCVHDVCMVCSSREFAGPEMVCRRCRVFYLQGVNRSAARPNRDTGELFACVAWQNIIYYHTSIPEGCFKYLLYAYGCCQDILDNQFLLFPSGSHFPVEQNVSDHEKDQ
jgi:hypothetical protein